MIFFPWFRNEERARDFFWNEGKKGCHWKCRTTRLRASNLRVGSIWVTEIAGNIISGYAFDALFFAAFRDPLFLLNRSLDNLGNASNTSLRYITFKKIVFSSFDRSIFIRNYTNVNRKVKILIFHAKYWFILLMNNIIKTF